MGLLSEARFVLGVGSGGAGNAYFSSLGLPNRPVAVMRDFLVVLRALLAGEEVTYSGPGLQLSRSDRLEPAPGARVPRGLGSPDVASGRRRRGRRVAQLGHARGNRLEPPARRGGCSVGRTRSFDAPAVHVHPRVRRRRRRGRAPGASRPGARLRPGSTRCRSVSLVSRSLCPDGLRRTALRELEALRETGASFDQLVARVPDDLLTSVGYYGPARGAAERYAALSVGLDETIVRVITARPGLSAVTATLEALTPAKIRAVSPS